MGCRIEVRHKSKGIPSSGIVEETWAQLGSEVVVDSAVAVGRLHNFGIGDFETQKESLVGMDYQEEAVKVTKA